MVCLPQTHFSEEKRLQFLCSNKDSGQVGNILFGIGRPENWTCLMSRLSQDRRNRSGAGGHFSSPPHILVDQLTLFQQASGGWGRLNPTHYYLPHSPQIFKSSAGSESLAFPVRHCTVMHFDKIFKSQPNTKQCLLPMCNAMHKQTC